MPLSARRLLALGLVAALGGAGTAQAVAAKDRPGGRRKAVKATQRSRPARAVKLAGATARPGVLAGARAPLTGTVAAGAAAGTPAAAALPGAITPTTTALPSTDPPPPAALQALGATVDERTGYTLRLSRTTLTAGTVVVQLVNQGEDPHNLRIVRTSPAGATADVPETAPSAQTAKTLTLSPGTYYLFCTLTTPVSHEAAGMHATLRVDP
jgi:plastocyanin